MVNIVAAKNSAELADMVDTAALDEGVTLRVNLTWGEDADRIEADYPIFADFLRAAEAKLFILVDEELPHHAA